MATTVAQLVRERRAQLKSLMLASRKLDASQEIVEREVRRLLNRKRFVPEVKDADRLMGMVGSTIAEADNVVTLLQDLSKLWGSL